MKSFLIGLFGFLSSLGAFGLLIVGILDSSFLFMPLGNDLLMIAMTAQKPKMLLVYAGMAAAGSVIGCALIDWISRKGGEEGLKKTLPERRIQYIKRKVSKNAGWAIALAAIMPPPFPFTPFIAGAAALGFPRSHLLALVGGMRLIRFSLVGLLAIHFGKRIIAMVESPAVQGILIGVVAISIGGSIWSVYRWIRRSRRVTHSSESPGLDDANSARA